MRILKDPAAVPANSGELHHRAAEVFRYACCILEMRDLLKKIQGESVHLRKTFLSEAEEKSSREYSDYFDERMRSLVAHTTQNLSEYQAGGWKLPADERGNADDE